MKMPCEMGFIMLSFQKDEGFFSPIVFLVNQVELFVLEVASLVRK